MKNRRIAIFTGNRAEYGLQFPIIKAVEAHPGLDYALLVSGAHLDEDFGATASEIERDGLAIHAQVKMNLPGDDLYATTQAVGSGVTNMSDILRALKPDLLVVYGDRFEGFAALVSGTQMGIPTAHIEGGDITEGGALDDSVRHAMTKLAHLHFTTNDEASRRVIRLGEERWRVQTVGFPTIDLIKQGLYASPDELAARYGLALDRPILLFTQHSIPTELGQVDAQIEPCLAAMEQLASRNYQAVVTYPNNDAGGKRIIVKLEQLKARAVPGIHVIPSLGRYNYHGVLNLCGNVSGGACVGNSSSGIKETAALNAPFVNIGERQKGRLQARNVLNVGYDTDAIVAACERATEDKRFRAGIRRCKNPYGTGDAGTKVADRLASVTLDLNLLQKKMTY